MEKTGKRFKEKYWKRQAHRKTWSKGARFIRGASGLIFLIIGIILLILPGPGWLLIILGASFLAGESLLLAKILDAIEVFLMSKINR